VALNIIIGETITPEIMRKINTSIENIGKSVHVDLNDKSEYHWFTLSQSITYDTSFRLDSTPSKLLLKSSSWVGSDGNASQLAEDDINTSSSPPPFTLFSKLLNSVEKDSPNTTPLSHP
jgi:hypothetical protein